MMTKAKIVHHKLRRRDGAVVPFTAIPVASLSEMRAMGETELSDPEVVAKRAQQAIADAQAAAAKGGA
jgi:hypothetical protein